MSRSRSGMLLGIALVAVGLVALLRRLVPWWMEANFLWGTAFLTVAAALFATALRQKLRGYLLLAWVATGIAAAIYLNGIGGRAEDVAGAAFLLCVSLGLLTLHTAHPRSWWLALLGGAVFVLAIITGASSLELLEGVAASSLLFFGLALVFFYLYLIRTAENRLGWARYPAVISLAVAALILANDQLPELRPYLWPLILLVTGAYLIFRDLLGARSRTERQEETSLPSAGGAETDS
ncbi:MAG: hypothetical protein ONB23_09920 [candidate division KSB1 bacterium]|nr:hypothetical protein [candidate division KSB1 bacterium]